MLLTVAVGVVPGACVCPRFSIITRARVRAADVHPLLASTIAFDASAEDSTNDPADQLVAAQSFAADTSDAVGTHPCFSLHRLVQEVVRDNSWRPRSAVATSTAVAVRVRGGANSSGAAGTGSVPQRVVVEAAIAGVSRAVSTRARFLPLWLVEHAAVLTAHVPADTVATEVLATDDDAHLARSVRGRAAVAAVALAS